MTDSVPIRIRKERLSPDTDLAGTRSLDGGEIHLWSIDLEDLPLSWDDLPGILGSHERARAARFRNFEARKQYIAAHSALRIVLAAYTGERPEKLSLGITGSGKPLVRGTGQDRKLRFNMSYSGGIAMIVVASGIEVGVDVERHEGHKVGEDSIEEFLTPEEMIYVDSLPSTARTKAIFDIWTAKEATAKGIGRGLALPLHDLTIEYRGGKPGRAVFNKTGPASRDTVWEIFPIKEFDGFSGAIAVGRSVASS